MSQTTSYTTDQSISDTLKQKAADTVDFFFGSKKRTNYSVIGLFASLITLKFAEAYFAVSACGV